MVWNIWGNKASSAKGRTVAHEMLKNYIPVKVLCKLEWVEVREN